MSLEAWEEHTLNSIADDLVASAPELASRLSVFNRLARGEQMPENLRGRAGRREQDCARPHRHHQRGRDGGLMARSADSQTLPVIPVVAVMALATAIMITVALVLSGAGHRPGGTGQAVQCPRTWAMPCPGR